MNKALHYMPIRSVMKMAVSGTFFFAICLFAACEKKPTASEQRESEKASSIQKVEDFQKLHRATADWFRVLDSVSPYTSEIQEALLSGNDSPRLLIADLLDISKNGEEIIASFGNEWIETEPRFRLRMTPEQAKEILKVVPDEDRLFASFVLAFHPESVTRPILRLDAEKNDEYAEVEVQNSQVTIITGACIAWQYLGAKGINMSDFLESQQKVIMKKLILCVAFDSLAPARLIRRFSQPVSPVELPCGSLFRPSPRSQFALRANFRFLLLTSSFLLLTSYFAPAATVEAEGRAPGDMKTAREHSDFLT